METSRGRRTYLLRIKMICARYLDILEQILMPLCRNWRRYFHPIRRINIEMRGHGCNDQEKRVFGRECLLKKASSLLSYDISCIETLITDRLLLIPLPSAVKVGVGVGVKQEIGSSKAGRIWGVVVVNVMSIEKLASVIGIDSCILQPYREVLLIQALVHKLGVSACSDSQIRRDSEPRITCNNGG